MKYWFLSFLLVFCASSSLQAGEYADAFLLSSHHPHAQSLGFSTVATTLHSGHALSNPAGFGHSKRSSVSLVYDHFSDLSSNLALEAIYRPQGNYKFGVSLIHSSIPDLFIRPNLYALTPQARRDSVLSSGGKSNDLIGYREAGVFLSIAREFDFEINLGWKFFKIPCRMPLGFSVKYIDKLLVENRGLGSGFDFGGQVFFSMAGMTRHLEKTEFGIGLFVSDILNTPVYWTTEHQDAIKRAFVVGYSITQHLDRLGTDVTFSTSRADRFGGESHYGLELKVKDMLYMRGGHDGEALSFGLGIGLKKFIIDYSFSQLELANRQKIGINYHF